MNVSVIWDLALITTAWLVDTNFHFSEKHYLGSRETPYLLPHILTIKWLLFLNMKVLGLHFCRYLKQTVIQSEGEI